MGAAQERAAVDVTVVTIDLRAVDDVPPAWAGCLPAEDQARLRRFHRAADRVSNTAAHCLLRLLLAAAVGESPHRLAIVRDAATGKPALSRPGAPHFNLSHADGMAAVALSRRLPVGVDVEGLLRHAVDAELVTAALGAAAWSRLARLPAMARRRAFFRAWTAREAMAKADGRGLSLPPEALRLSGDRGMVRAPAGRRWWIARPAVGPLHVAAVATPAPVRVLHRALTAADLAAWAGTEARAA